jgi:RNA polymerase sigma factor (sigma-70 family)
VIRPRFRFGLRPAAIRSADSPVSDDVSVYSLADRAPDAALMSALAVDDEAAAVAFVRRFQGPVFGLAVSITHDRALAEDVAQEAFLRAWRAAGNYDARRGSVLTWLLTITRNLAIDAIRARRSFPLEAGELEVLITTTLGGGAPDGSGGRIEAMAAAERLAQLPVEQARAVVLAVIGGRTVTEVADYEGIPLGTAKTRIRTGLRRMRLAMEAERD